MDHIWTPWRFDYIKSVDRCEHCIFCHLLDQENDRDSLILARRRHNYLVLNRFPYTAGHLMIVARRHVASLTEAEAPELKEIILLCRDCEAALREVYRPDGFNVGFNIGRSAGAGVAGHLHLHVVPRWTGDTNVVSVIGETRVIPEDLQITYDKLAPHF